MIRIFILMLMSFGAFANSYYTPTGNPTTGSAMVTSVLRSEYSLIGSGFNKLPDLTGLPVGYFVVTNSAGNALIAEPPSTALATLGAQPASSTLTSLSSTTPSSTGLALLQTSSADTGCVLVNCISVDGSSTVTANIPMATHKLTGLTPGATSGDSVEYSQALTWINALESAIQYQLYSAFSASGTAPTFTVTPSPSLPSLVANQRLSVIFPANGNGSDTLNVNGLGAKSIKQYNNYGVQVPPVITSGIPYDVEYNGTNWIILNPQNSSYPVTTSGNSGQILQSQGTSGTSWVEKIIIGSQIAMSGQSNIDILSPPASVNRIVLSISGLQKSSSGLLLLQLGTGSTPVTSGYTGSASSVVSSSTSSQAWSSGAALVAPSISSAFVYNGIITLINMGNNLWAISSSIGQSDQARVDTAAGTIQLSGALGIVRITTASGSETFSSGVVNSLTE